APSRPERRVHPIGSARLPTAFGTFTVHGYRDLRSGSAHVALVAERPDDVPAGADAMNGAQQAGAPAGTPPLVRVHSECLTGDAFSSLRCDCGPQLEASMAQVAAHGGAVVYL